MPTWTTYKCMYKEVNEEMNKSNKEVCVTMKYVLLSHDDPLQLFLLVVTAHVYNRKKILTLLLRASKVGSPAVSISGHSDREPLFGPWGDRSAISWEASYLAKYAKCWQDLSDHFWTKALKWLERAQKKQFVLKKMAVTSHKNVTGTNWTVTIPPWLCFSTCQGESLTKQWTYGPT